MTRPTALITGASSGIGAELARIFAANGYDLIIAARRRKLLDAVAAECADPADIQVVEVDLSRARGAERLYRTVAETQRPVDVLVNNAGVMETGPLLGASRGRLTNLINLNVRALAELMHQFGADMVERGYGRILNVASVAAFQPVPGMAAYAASKAFVLSLTEAFSEELVGSGVTVTALCPGPTRTGMAEAVAQFERFDWLLADARSVAREGFDACRSGQVIRIPGAANQALVGWSHFQPRWLVRTLSGLMARSADLLK